MKLNLSLFEDISYGSKSRIIKLPVCLCISPHRNSCICLLVWGAISSL